MKPRTEQDRSLSLKRKGEDDTNNSEEQINKQVNLGDGKAKQLPQLSKEIGIAIKQCLHDKNYKNLVKVTENQPEIYKEYKKLKFKNTIYQIDDSLLIANGQDPENDYVGILKKIVRIDFEQVHTLILLQWYYKKTDIPPKWETYKECFSENELFLTEHSDYVLVDSINGKCDILEYDEYDSLPQIPNATFYMRSSYDATKQKFNPPIEKWKKGCICRKPLNPDLLYIQCEKCENWIHTDCVGLSQSEVDNIEDYVCSMCNKE